MNEKILWRTMTTIKSKYQKQCMEISCYLLRNPEIAFEEFKAKKKICGFLEENEFSIVKDIRCLPTGFIAQYGEGKPTIAILGEFDAVSNETEDAISHKISCRSIRVRSSDARGRYGIKCYQHDSCQYFSFSQYSERSKKRARETNRGDEQ